MRSRQAWFPVACVGVTAQLPGSGCSSGRPGWGGLGGCAGGFSSSWHWFGGDSVLCVLGVGVGDVRQGRSFAAVVGGWADACLGPGGFGLQGRLLRGAVVASRQRARPCSFGCDPGSPWRCARSQACSPLVVGCTGCLSSACCPCGGCPGSSPFGLLGGSIAPIFKKVLFENKLI